MREGDIIKIGTLKLGYSPICMVKENYMPQRCYTSC